MATERNQMAGKRQARVERRPPSAAAGTRSLFGNKIRATLVEMRELRDRSRNGHRAAEPGRRRLFGNKLRETLGELADLRERKRIAKGIARDD